MDTATKLTAIREAQKACLSARSETGAQLALQASNVLSQLNRVMVQIDRLETLAVDLAVKAVQVAKE